MPISAIDVNGDSIYIVTETGQVWRIDEKNADQIRKAVGYDILVQVVDGENLMKKYVNNSSHDVYIAISVTEFKIDDNNIVGAATLYRGKEKAFDDENKKISTLPLIEDGSIPYSQFDIFDGILVKNPKRTFSLVLFNSGFQRPWNSIYDMAEGLFHEIKAHIDLPLYYAIFGGTRQHDTYGSKTAGIDNARTFGSPAFKIAKQLRDLRKQHEMQKKLEELEKKQKDMLEKLKKRSQSTQDNTKTKKND